MLNINETIVAGIIGNDLDVRQDADGKPFTRFNVSTTEEGDETNAVNWHRCIAKDELAEQIETACQKGTNVFLRGSMKTNFFEAGNGMKKEVTELQVSSFQVCADGRVPLVDIEDYMTERDSKVVAAKDDTPF